jgi:Ca2+-binding EF-hand superfamily protein
MYTNTIKAILLNQKKLFELAKIAFESVDITKSGEIDEIDLGKVLVDISKNLGGDPPTQEDINEVMKHLDADRSGTIDLNEFTLLIKDILYAMLEDA